jgi:hypothetical protein
MNECIDRCFWKLVDLTRTSTLPVVGEDTRCPYLVESTWKPHVKYVGYDVRC